MGGWSDEMQRGRPRDQFYFYVFFILFLFYLFSILFIIYFLFYFYFYFIIYFLSDRFYFIKINFSHKIGCKYSTRVMEYTWRLFTFFQKCKIGQSNWWDIADICQRRGQGGHLTVSRTSHAGCGVRQLRGVLPHKSIRVEERRTLAGFHDWFTTAIHQAVKAVSFKNARN